MGWNLLKTMCGLACPVASTNLKTFMLNFIKNHLRNTFVSHALKGFETAGFRYSAFQFRF